MTGNREDGDHRGILSDVALFAGLNAEELSRVMDLSRLVEFASGSVIVDQGDPGTSCFVILDGTASVYVRGEYVATSGKGSLVGEMALVDHRPRTATVIADSQLSCLQFDSAAFRKLLDEMPKSAERIFTTLRSRIDRLEQL